MAIVINDDIHMYSVLLGGETENTDMCEKMYFALRTRLSLCMVWCHVRGSSSYSAQLTAHITD